MDLLFHALAHDTRRALLDRLHAEPGQTLSELCGEHGMSRQAVSKHLEVLEAAGLVATRWRGREKLHFINPVPLCEAYDTWMHRYVTPQARALVRLGGQIERALRDREGRRA